MYRFQLVQNNPNFATYVPGLTEYNQYLDIYVYFYVQNMNFGVNVDEEVYLSVFQTVEASEKLFVEGEIGTMKVEVGIDTESPQFKENGKVMGYYQKLGYIHTIPASNLLFASSIPSLSSSNNIRNVTLQIKTANPEATRMYYIIRIIFFCISILTFIAYAIRISLMHRSRKVLEQRFVMTMGFTLILFNDPFFFITLTRTNNSSTFFSSLFYLMFPVALIFFFMCAFERADLENTQESHIMKNPMKWCLIIVTFAILLGFYLYSALNMSESYSGTKPDYSQITYKSLKGFSLILVSLCYLVALYHFIQICLQYETKPQRYRTLLNISMFYFFYSFIAFISSSFCIFNNWPSITYLNFTIFNSYIYILQFLYSPTKQEIRRKYPGKLSNAEVMQKAGDYLANEFKINDMIGLSVGSGNNTRERQQGYDRMSDELRTDYRWSSMNDGGRQMEEQIGKENNSMPDIKNYAISDRLPAQEIQPNYNIEIDVPNNNPDNYQIQDQQHTQQYKIDEDKYYYDENNQHEKVMEDPEEENNGNEQNNEVLKESVLLSLSESGYQYQIPYGIKSESEILEGNQYYDERGTVSNVLDDIYRGEHSMEEEREIQMEEQLQDFDIGEPEITEQQKQQNQ